MSVELDQRKSGHPLSLLARWSRKHTLGLIPEENFPFLRVLDVVELRLDDLE